MEASVCGTGVDVDLSSVAEDHVARVGDAESVVVFIVQDEDARPGRGFGSSGSVFPARHGPSRHMKFVATPDAAEGAIFIVIDNHLDLALRYLRTHLGSALKVIGVQGDGDRVRAVRRSGGS